MAARAFHTENYGQLEFDARQQWRVLTTYCTRAGWDFIKTHAQAYWFICPETRALLTQQEIDSGTPYATHQFAKVIGAIRPGGPEAQSQSSAMDTFYAAANRVKEAGMILAEGTQAVSRQAQANRLLMDFGDTKYFPIIAHLEIVARYLKSPSSAETNAWSFESIRMGVSNSMDQVQASEGVLQFGARCVSTYERLSKHGGSLFKGLLKWYSLMEVFLRGVPELVSGYVREESMKLAMESPEAAKVGTLSSLGQVYYTNKWARAIAEADSGMAASQQLAGNFLRQQQTQVQPCSPQRSSLGAAGDQRSSLGAVEAISTMQYQAAQYGAAQAKVTPSEHASPVPSVMMMGSSPLRTMRAVAKPTSLTPTQPAQLPPEP